LQVNVSAFPSWKAIFFFEGIITIAGGIFAFFVVPNEPATAKFLNAEERIMADARVRRDQAGAKVLIEATKIKLVLKAFRNLNVGMPILLQKILQKKADNVLIV
jgi:sugar phosphate permease